MAMFDDKIIISLGFCLKFLTTMKLYCGLDIIFFTCFGVMNFFRPNIIFCQDPVSYPFNNIF